jgi:hypothetical protein
VTPAVLAAATVWLVVLMVRSARLRRLAADRGPTQAQPGQAQARAETVTEARAPEARS